MKNNFNLENGKLKNSKSERIKPGLNSKLEIL